MSSVYTPSPIKLTSITIPGDGDPESAASVNIPFEALADGVAYLNPRGYIVNQSSLIFDVSTHTAVGGDATWQDFTSTYLSIAGCQVNDSFQIDLTCDLLNHCETSGGLDIRMGVVQDVGGANAASTIVGTGRHIDAVPHLGSASVQISIAGIYVVSVAGTLRFVLQGNTHDTSAGGTNGNLELGSGFALIATRLGNV